jgi:hypothetical protein
MVLRSEAIAVIYDQGWKIKFRDNRFGPYPNRKEAVATATLWVHNARKQGHEVVLAIQPEAGELDVESEAVA